MVSILTLCTKTAINDRDSAYCSIDNRQRQAREVTNQIRGDTMIMYGIDPQTGNGQIGRGLPLWPNDNRSVHDFTAARIVSPSGPSDSSSSSPSSAYPGWAAFLGLRMRSKTNGYPCLDNNGGHRVDDTNEAESRTPLSLTYLSGHRLAQGPVGEPVILDRDPRSAHRSVWNPAYLGIGQPVSLARKAWNSRGTALCG